MNKEENGIFIKLLEIGEEKGANGITKTQALNRLGELGLMPTSSYDLAEQLFFECFDFGGKTIGYEGRCALKAEYYFRLLEYRELKEARQTAKQANRNAIFAIILAIATLLVTVLMPLFTTLPTGP